MHTLRYKSCSLYKQQLINNFIATIIVQDDHRIDLAVLILALVPMQFSGLPLSLERLLSMKEVIWTWIVMHLTQDHFPVYIGSTPREGWPLLAETLR